MELAQRSFSHHLFPQYPSDRFYPTVMVPVQVLLFPPAQGYNSRSQLSIASNNNQGWEETYKLTLLLWCHRSVNCEGARVSVDSVTAWLYIISFLLDVLFGFVTYNISTFGNVDVDSGSVAGVSTCNWGLWESLVWCGFEGMTGSLTRVSFFSSSRRPTVQVPVLVLPVFPLPTGGYWNC